MEMVSPTGILSTWDNLLWIVSRPRSLGYSSNHYYDYSVATTSHQPPEKLLPPPPASPPAKTNIHQSPLAIDSHHSPAAHKNSIRVVGIFPHFSPLRKLILEVFSFFLSI